MLIIYSDSDLKKIVPNVWADLTYCTLMWISRNKIDHYRLEKVHEIAN